MIESERINMLSSKIVLSAAPPMRCRRRRGVSIVYVSVSMIVLLGFCSLAVDLGRVQTAKSELERATDAAARAAVASISSGVSAVQTAAYNMANNNSADGQAVTINSVNNVVFLNWPSTTPLTGSARSSANAVQVSASYAVPLLFAQAIGMATCTVHATSTAFTQTTTTYGLIGTGTVETGGGPSDSVDSYNSSLGPYGVGNHGSQGSIAGQTIDINGGSVVNGNIYYYGGTAPNTSGGTVNGTISNVSSLPSYPTPTIPAGCTNLGTVNIGSGQTLTLNSGNYCCTSFTFLSTGTLNINATSGPVNLYLAGAFLMDYVFAGGQLNFTSTIPNNFHIYATTSAQISFNGNSTVYGVVDAPLSTFQVTGGSFYGSAIANELYFQYGAAIHYDQALGTSGTTTSISQVQ